MKSRVTGVGRAEKCQNQEGGLEATTECLVLQPLHLGQETGRTFRKDCGGELGTILVSECITRDGQGDNRPLVLVIWS